MKSHKNLHPQVCSLENVMAAARSAMQGKLSSHAAARFHARWETHAVQLAEELANGSWQPGKYTYFDIHEPKLRRVAAAPFRDRVVHHALVRVLALIQRILETHEDGHRMEWGEDLFACHIRRHGLPIGNLTSQFFANVHLDGFDHFVKQELGVKGYVRYMDDFRLVARAARGLVEQQREQPARIQPQQQRPHEREQQRGVPRRQALEGALPSHR